MPPRRRLKGARPRDATIWSHAAVTTGSLASGSRRGRGRVPRGTLAMGMIDTGTLFALAAAATLAVGFAIYAGQTARGVSRPNGASWIMWSYGGALPLFAGAGAGAPRAILASYAVVFIGALSVAAAHWSRRRPGEAAGDWPPLLGNAGIVLWSLLALAGPSAESGFEADAGLVFVLLSGLAAVTAAWPTLSGVVLDPARERPLAWFVWSVGYGLMALAAMGEGLGWHSLVPPLLAQAVHLMIGVLALGLGESFPRQRTSPLG